MQDNQPQANPEQQPAQAPGQPSQTVQPTQPMVVTPGNGMFERRIGRLGFLLGLVYIVLFFTVPILAYALINWYSSGANSTSDLAGSISNTLLFLWSIVGLALILPVTFSLYIRRLHDLNQTGLFSILMIVSPLNLLLYLYLQIMPAKDEVNQYGPAVNDYHPLVILGFKKPRV